MTSDPEAAAKIEKAADSLAEIAAKPGPIPPFVQKMAEALIDPGDLPIHIEYVLGEPKGRV